MISFEKVAGLVVLALLLRWGYGVVYSIFFSPLRNIPGPFLLQLIPFYDRLVLIAGKLPWLERKYHAQFGPVYRKGWNMVQVVSEEALREIYSTHAYRKSDVYLFFQGNVQTIFNTIDRDFHRRRKRIMAPAFTTKEIEALHPVILSQGVQVLVSVLENNVNQCVNMHTLFGCFALDMIGVLGFGQSFNTLTNGPHIVETWYRKQLIRMFFNILIPGLKRVYNPYSERLHAFTQEAVDRVREQDTPSIMASLIKAFDPETGDKLSDQEINAEALLQIFAGSDSTASVMTWSLYHILQHPRVYEKIVGELTAHKQDTSPSLEAAIKETMRVMPPIAGSLERVVPSGGRTIDGYFLPGGVISFCL
ncbi:hypothetical protein DSO57_1027409 [Entomophthora muscae]|uniref:Uncharacterized protein n=1 Tax=Entomophthora muscae TaxID=34485 RepID=A0ACC2T214_9FUNG|nr:hypothetical protein DSO57_1027409 [Entomophthora muscae]